MGRRISDRHFVEMLDAMARASTMALFLQESADDLRPEDVKSMSAVIVSMVEAAMEASGASRQDCMTAFDRVNSEAGLRPKLSS